MKEIKNSHSFMRGSYQKLEDVLGCKWSVSVLQAIGAGVTRPGALERYIVGISTKVLTERLRKLSDYGLLSKQIFAQVPPKTEYGLTPMGEKLLAVIQQIHLLNNEMSAKQRIATDDRSGG